MGELSNSHEDTLNGRGVVSVEVSYENIVNIFEVGRYDSTRGIICMRTVLVSPSVNVTVWSESFST